MIGDAAQNNTVLRNRDSGQKRRAWLRSVHQSDSLALVSLVVIGASSETDAEKKCATKPIAELVTASEAASKHFNNDREFTCPIAELIPRASGFS